MAVSEGVGLVEVVLLHESVFDSLVADLGATVDLRLLRARAREFLAEALVPLEMEQRGYRDLVSSLRQTNRELEQASEMKLRFLANMSHELRNPLNSVLGFAQLLPAIDSANLTDTQLRYIGNIERSGQQLLALVNDLLDLSKIVSDQMSVSLEVVAVDEVVDTCLAQMEPQASARSLRLGQEGSARLLVLADRRRLLQVLINLVSNAIKFTPAGGSVTVDRSRHDDVVALRVSDTGLGIPADKLDFIFDEFAQIESGQSGDQQGTGLGLPLSRRLAELMGGRIDLASEVGKGSTFSIILPIAGMGDGGPGREPTRGRGGRIASARVLVVDDDPILRQLVRATLEGGGTEIAEAADGDTALEMARRLGPQLILLDLDIPGPNGPEVCRRLRAEKIAGRIVMLTAQARTVDRELGLAAGADAYLAKPFSPLELLEMVDELLESDPGVKPA